MRLPNLTWPKLFIMHINIIKYHLPCLFVLLVVKKNKFQLKIIILHLDHLLSLIIYNHSNTNSISRPELTAIMKPI